MSFNLMSLFDTNIFFYFCLISYCLFVSCSGIFHIPSYPHYKCTIKQNSTFISHLYEKKSMLQMAPMLGQKKKEHIDKMVKWLKLNTSLKVLEEHDIEDLA